QDVGSLIDGYLKPFLTASEGWTLRVTAHARGSVKSSAGVDWPRRFIPAWPAPRTTPRRNRSVRLGLANQQVAREASGRWHLPEDLCRILDSVARATLAAAPDHRREADSSAWESRSRCDLRTTHQM